MTKNLLEQYSDICGELRDLERLVTDSVSGSLPEPPYTQHTVAVQGIPYTDRRANLERKKVEIEAFVEGLPEAGEIQLNSPWPTFYSFCRALSDRVRFSCFALAGTNFNVRVGE